MGLRNAQYADLEIAKYLVISFGFSKDTARSF